MCGEYFLTIDLGTSAIKSVLWDMKFHMVAKSSLEIVTYYPKPMWAEQDQGEWWTCVLETIRETVRKAGISPEEIAGIGICGQGHGLNLVDSRCRPLHRCLVWPDLRAVKQAEEIKRSGIKNVWLPIAPYYTAAKLLWMKVNHPKIVDEAYKILLPKDFIRAKLIGSFCTDVTDAYLTQLYDAVKRSWSWKLLDFMGIPHEKLPEVYPSERIVGRVTEEAARKAGLEVGTPVIAGSVDDWITPIVQALKPKRDILIYLGTAPALLLVVEPKEGLAPGRREGCIYGYMSAGGGALLKWFKEQFGYREEKMAERLSVSPYKLMDEEAEKAKPGSGGLLFLPHMMGERSPKGVYRPNPHMKGVLFGLCLGHKRQHVIRSMMEGITYQLRTIWDSIKEKNPGLEIDRVLVLGGGAKSRVWREIIANVIGFPVHLLAKEETAALNQACLVSVGLGLHESFSKATEKLELSTASVVEPKAQQRDRYDRLYELYKRLEADLTDAFNATSKINDYGRV